MSDFFPELIDFCQDDDSTVSKKSEKKVMQSKKIMKPKKKIKHVESIKTKSEEKNLKVNWL